MQERLPQDLETLVLDVARATSIVGIELVQSLWSGYGHILRCKLAGGPRASVIVKHVSWPTAKDHPRGWNSDVGHERKVRSYEVETAWYENHAQLCTDESRVPKSLAVRSHNDETFIVLEDLNGAGFAGRSRRASDPAIFSCLRWLAHFHATFMGHEPVDLWPVGTYWHLATRPEELAVLGDTELARAAEEIDRRLRASPFQTMVHGDAKLANFCFSPGELRAAAVDFQYVGGGCGMKDVAYFLSSCLDEGECERREDELLEFYFGVLGEALQAKTVPVDTTALERDWRRLYPVAWTDFYRFLQGWSPGHWKIHRYSERLAREVLSSL